jgi:uncharacterized membrane protein
MADNADLEQRIAHLEAVVSELQRTLAGLAVSPQSETSESQLTPAARPRQAPVLQDEIVFVPEASSVHETEDQVPKALNLVGVNREEFWLNRLGIGLLLLGVAFLFKYSIDQGWIVPEIRVGFGFGLGLVLLFLGWRLQQQRSALS